MGLRWPLHSRVAMCIAIINYNIDDTLFLTPVAYLRQGLAGQGPAKYSKCPPYSSGQKLGEEGVKHKFACFLYFAMAS